MIPRSCRFPGGANGHAPFLICRAFGALGEEALLCEPYCHWLAGIALQGEAYQRNSGLIEEGIEGLFDVAPGTTSHCFQKFRRIRVPVRILIEVGLDAATKILRSNPVFEHADGRSALFVGDVIE